MFSVASRADSGDAWSIWYKIILQLPFKIVMKEACFCCILWKWPISSNGLKYLFMCLKEKDISKWNHPSDHTAQYSIWVISAGAVTWYNAIQSQTVPISNYGSNHINNSYISFYATARAGMSLKLKARFTNKFVKISSKWIDKKGSKSVHMHPTETEKCHISYTHY